MEINNSSNPLVSVVVVAYNSSATVLETLDSIKNQTYRNIELIITDDASKDDTVSLCNKWLDANGERFVLAKVVTNEKNTGISANANRGCFASQGEWIKIIAGDDKLFPSCVEDNVNFIQCNPHVDIVFSCLKAFGDGDNDTISYLNSIIWTKPNKLNIQDLHMLECYYNIFGTPTSFFSKSLFLSLGGFNYNIPLIEDWPFWVKVTKHYKVIVMDRVTVWYRVHNKSISRHNEDKNNPYFENLKLCKWENIKYMRKISPLFGALGYLDYKIEYHNNIMWRFLGLSRYINPYYYKRKRINKIIFPLYDC